MRRRTFWLIAVLLAWFGRDGARGQHVLSLATITPTVTPLSPVTIRVILSSSPAAVAALQFTLSPPTNATFGTSTFLAGQQAAAAGKSIYCKSPAIQTCLVTGPNATAIQSGELAMSPLTAPTTPGIYHISLTGAVAVDGAGNGVTIVTGAPLTITVSAPGDLTGDGIFDDKDMAELAMQILGVKPCIADQNGDGRCDIFDVIPLVRKGLGL